MILSIDTSDNINIRVCLEGEAKDCCIERLATRSQGEKLLPAIEDLLKKARLKLSNLKGIKVANKGGSFTSLRIGVATANALAFALGVPVMDLAGLSLEKNGLKVVEPEYGGAPNIGVHKS
jgi:tRNA threonylcarbamoyladenosine biosynthesis protein TsaB